MSDALISNKDTLMLKTYHVVDKHWFFHSF